MPSKQVLLKKFTAIIYKHDPMDRHSKDRSEYEVEALSILSRFCEASLQLADDEQAIVDTAKIIIDQTFQFWFDQALADSLPLTHDLLKAYLDSFPNEQVSDVG